MPASVPTQPQSADPDTLRHRMEMTELLDAAGEYEQPVGTVLRSLAVSLRLVAERMVETEAKLEELTMITDGHHDTMLDEENADQSRT